MEYSFTEEEFVTQVERSKNWGEPTSEIMDMMEEMIIHEARHFEMTPDDKHAMVESSIADFESSGLLQGLITNAQLSLGGVVDNFQSSICCTFKHYKRKTNE